MKKISILLLSISTFLFTSCERWLDVQPSDQLVDSELFKDADGFRHSLNGIYQQMTSNHLYGKNLSWGMNSALGQEYENGKMHFDQQIAYNFDQEHQYSRDIIEKIWTTAFNSIANCNKLLQDIEKLPENKFPEGRYERNLIIGETKAMRALLHFELLRLYAPSPKNGLNDLSMPYVKHYPARSNPLIPSSEVLKNITEDLLSAQSLVAENDTLVNSSIMMGKLASLLSGFGFIPKGGRFFTHRMHRLNYVAIHGLLARVYLYAGNIPLAKQHAKSIYDNYGPHGKSIWWEFTAENHISGDDRYHKLANDIILGFYNEDLVANNIASGLQNYRLTPYLSQWLPSGERDYRSTFIREISTTVSSQRGSVHDKWTESRSSVIDVSNQNLIIPVLRMSEIYYIYSECLFIEGQPFEALRILNQVRNGRGKLSVFAQTDESAFYDELIQEYHREFLTEGQTIFAYKRLQRDLKRGTQTIPMDKRFQLPIPEREQIF